MNDFKKFRDGFVGPIIILFVICLLSTWAVAATFNVADPIIQSVEAQRVLAARQEVLPEADDFIKYEDAGLPEGVTEAYKANNDAGFVFLASAKGYDGSVPFMIGLDAQGKVTGIKMLTNKETKGLGSRVGEPEYLNQFTGSGNADDVQSISGATKTSNALKNSLRIALEAYELLKDQQPGEAR